MIYLVCFFISFIFAREAGKAKTKTMFILFSILSIAPTILLAGLRDYSIGRDTINYYELPMYWKGAIKCNSIWGYVAFRGIYRAPEILYSLYMGAIAQWTGSYRFYLILTHTIMLTCVYAGVFRFRKYVAPELLLLLFYLFHYAETLNIARQYLAMSILIFAQYDINLRRYKRYCVAVLIAFMIHSSAILGLTPMLLYIILYGKDHQCRASFSRRSLILITMLIGGVAFVPLLNKLLNIGILASRYSFFLNSDEAVLSFFNLECVALELILVVTLLQKNMIRRYWYVDYYLYGSIIYLILLVCSAYIVYGRRIAAYFAFMNIITVSLMTDCYDKMLDKKIAKTLVIIFSILYWLQLFARHDVNTFPYKLGI